MSRIVGLDLGTNSIGWAVVEKQEEESKQAKDRSSADAEASVIVKALGSRVIPMDAATMGDYEKGALQSAAAARRLCRGTRRLYQRSALRRERLLRVLNIMHFLPAHYRDAVDFAQHPGQFKEGEEPLLAYKREEDGRMRFLFMDAFSEMLADFQQSQPQLVSEGKRVPLDWTLYYLRKKALSQPVSREELAWIILSFNTKRGYYSLDDEDAASASTPSQEGKTEEYKVLTVTAVEQLGPDKKRPGSFWWEISFEGGASSKKASSLQPRQVGDRVEAIVETTYDANGQVKKDKAGKPLVKVRTPKADDWTLLKKRTESDIERERVTVGEYIYEHLLGQPEAKVRGRLVRTIGRDFYQEELKRILSKQKEYISELQDRSLYETCVRKLYPHNEAHVQSLLQHDFSYLLTTDIIFYQRPLKRGKVKACPYEHRRYRDRCTGEETTVPVPCIIKSHPLYQEFRLWQFISNLHIYRRQEMENGRLRTDVDVTSLFIPGNEARAALFDQLWEVEAIGQKALLALVGIKKKDIGDYRWNYVEDKSYPCNETWAEIERRRAKTDCPPLDEAQKLHLWHICLSVSDKKQKEKALSRLAAQFSCTEASFTAAYMGYTPHKNATYGAYSEKAIKKLLTLMRAGHHWKEEDIDANTRRRIGHIADGEVDETISNRTREVAQRYHIDATDKCTALSPSTACYIVYDRYSEAVDQCRWEQPSDIDAYLREQLPPGTLRNPVVEKVVTETLKVVRDIWTTYGTIDEIHVEMGRSLKQTSEQRKKSSERIALNERTNLRIRHLLQEFADPAYGIAGVHPRSPMQQEALKIFEEGVMAACGEQMPDDIRTIRDALGSAKDISSITRQQVQRYKCWIEQKYQSPYTGQVIPLSRLFTRDYEIEHVIPRSRYYDDSLTNKVLCETAVNHRKDNRLAYEFINECGGELIDVGGGRSVKVFSKEEYEDFVREHYASQPAKFKRLLMDDIPEDFIERQLNDTRYMSRKVLEILSLLVREEDELEAKSKHVIATNGAITDRLKGDWGLKDVWNQLVAPRFERLNALTHSHSFGRWVEQDGQRFFQSDVPLECSRGFSKKRIDHRHHALDALVIACTTQKHVNLLNNVNAASADDDTRRQLRTQLCRKNNKGEWQFRKPTNTFTQDAEKSLQGIIVSFKQNTRVISPAHNTYWHYNQEGVKVRSRQVKGDGWSIRKSLHKATTYGIVSLQQRKKEKLATALTHPQDICSRSIRAGIKQVADSYRGKVDPKTLNKYFKDRKYLLEGKDISEVEVYCYTQGKEQMAATRKTLDNTFNDTTIAKVTDSCIRAILTAHLRRYDDSNGNAHPDLAFAPEGIARMNKDIRQLNRGKPHKPVFSVRIAEKKGAKNPVGEKGAKGRKYAEAADSTNLFFAIYADEKGERSFMKIPYRMAVERMKQHLPAAPETNENGHHLLFTLSPNDLVYVPEKNCPVPPQLDTTRIYKMVSCDEGKCHFVHMSLAKVIVSGEVESGNKSQHPMDDKNVDIKKVCHKLIVDRLGRLERIIPSPTA